MVFALLPFFILFFILGCMISIFRQVRQIEDTAKKYASAGQFGSSGPTEGANASLGLPTEGHQSGTVNRIKSRAVARQARAYALAFLATYLLDLVSMCIHLATEQTYFVLDLVAYGIVLPSYGTFNFLVFARTRQMKTTDGKVWRSLVFWKYCRRLAPSAPGTINSTQDNVISDGAAQSTT